MPTHPGTYLWKSPHNFSYLVTNTGTHPLGNNPFAHATWNGAEAPSTSNRVRGSTERAA